MNYLAYHAPGNHTEIRFDHVRAQLHLIQNKTRIASFDLEQVHDLLIECLSKTRCRRPGIKRRAALLHQ